VSESDYWQLHAVVSGRVQGVGFRFFVQENARQFGLTGWVRNQRDGTVEVLACGSRQNLEILLAALQRGPRSAFVSNVQSNWETGQEKFSSFRVRMTC